MGQKRIQANLYKRYGKEEAEKRIIAHRKKVKHLELINNSINL